MAVRGRGGETRERRESSEAAPLRASYASSNLRNVDQGKRERRFLEAVRLSGLVPEIEIDRAVAFQKFAHARGKPLPLDRILLKFGLLDEKQIEALYRALTYFLWRKEDKLYAKIAVKNQLLTAQDSKRCLKEQKRAFKEKRVLRRFNEIAFEKGLLNPNEDRALVTRLKELKPGLTLGPVNANGKRAPDEERGQSSSPKSAQAGEESQWRKDMHARELKELKSASGVEPQEDDESSAPADDLQLSPDPDDDEEDDKRPPHLSTDDDDFGDPISEAKGPVTTDDDLDPLWAEADLDDVELDSEQRQAARKKTESSADDETDVF